ncbi:MAG TPA: hypothetical protein QGI71_00225 [Dehalococcoidia bacterium]|nr:hypothetical protein [Dehalococcoidia bacterium]
MLWTPLTKASWKALSVALCAVLTTGSWIVLMKSLWSVRLTALNVGA